MTIPEAMQGWPVRSIAAASVVVMSLVLATAFRWFLRRAGRTDRVARLLNRTGLVAGLVEPSLDQMRSIVGWAAYWIVNLAGFLLALSIFSNYAAARLMELILAHAPKTILGLAVLWVFRWLAGYWSRSTLVAAANEGVPYPWRWAAVVYAGTIFVGIALASELTGIATSLIRSAFLIVLAGVVLLCVLSLAPGLKAHLSSRESKATERAGEIFR